MPIKTFPKIIRNFSGCEIIENNIENNLQVDHINIIMIVEPMYGVADIIWTNESSIIKYQT